MDPIRKLETGRSTENVDQQAKTESSREDHQEVTKTVESVSEGLNVLNENADLNVTGEVSEKSRQGSERSAQGGAVARTSTATQVQALPSVDEMIHQTVVAIEIQLKKKEEEVRILERRKSTKPYELNNAAREIRFLNGLLYQLKTAAKQATDFIVNLWKQYVSKTS